MSFAVGTFKDENEYGAQPFLQIPVDGEKLAVPKAFYHYSEQGMRAKANFGIPDDEQLMNTDTLFVNNRKDINGIYLPLPNMDPINLHFINQRTYEKGLDTNAHELNPDRELFRAKRICKTMSDVECEKALLRYHRVKSDHVRKARQPLHEQLLGLAELTSSARVHDKEGEGLGVVVGLPGYEPLYVGANMGVDNDYNVRFSPPS